MKSAIDEMFMNYEVWVTTLDSMVYSYDQKSRLDAMIAEIASKVFTDFLSVRVDREMKWIKVECKSETILYAAGSVSRLSQNHDQRHL